MKKNLIFGLLYVVLASTAHAKITLYWDYTSNAATALDGTLLDKVVGTLHSAYGERVTAIDFGPGLSGTFYQDWLFGGALPSTYTDFFGNSTPAVDTHLLFPYQGEVIEVATVVEDNDKSMSSSAGWGSSFTGAIGILDLYQTEMMDFIQMYIKSGTYTNYEISVLSTNGTRLFKGDLSMDGYTKYLCSLSPDVAYTRVDTPAIITLTVTDETGGEYYSLTGTFPSASGEFGPGGTSGFGPLDLFESDSRQYSYTPTARGSDTQSITVTSNRGNVGVTLSGTGLGPVLDSSMAPGSTLDFDEVLPGTPESFYLDISNITTDENGGDDSLTDLTLLDVTIGGDDSVLFDIVGFATNTLVHKDGVLSLELSYNGTGTPGIKNATLDIFTDEDAALGAAGSIFSYSISANVVPEPSTLVLLIVGSIGPLFVRRR